MKTTKDILLSLKDTDCFKELVPSEYAKDEEYQNGMMVDGESFRMILGETEFDVQYFLGLSESESYGYWNELRRDGFILDVDAPDEQTIEEWAEYLLPHVVPNVPLLLSEFLSAIAESDSFMGSDGMVGNEPSFQHDFTRDGTTFQVHITGRTHTPKIL